MSSEPPFGTDTQPAALRDAADIVGRTTADEAEAVAARDQYRNAGLPTITPDPEIAARLRPGEGVVQVRPAAMLVREHFAGPGAADEGMVAAGTATVEQLSGRLYLTTSRLVLLARASAADGPAYSELSVELAEIDELAVVGERLLVSLSDGMGITIDAGRPRTLRVQVAAARAAVRSEAQQREDESAPTGVGLALGTLGVQLEP